MAKVKVTIPEERFIPTLGKGPFRKPTIISEEQYRMIKRMGYIINIVDDNDKTTMETAVIERELVGAEDVEIIQTVKDEEEPQKIVIVEETPEEEPELIAEEVIEEDEDESEYLTDEEVSFLMKATKPEIQKFFNEQGIEYSEDDTIRQLLEHVGLKR